MRRWITTLVTASALTLGIAGLATPAQAGNIVGGHAKGASNTSTTKKHAKATQGQAAKTDKPASPAERVKPARQAAVQKQVELDFQLINARLDLVDQRKRAEIWNGPVATSQQSQICDILAYKLDTYRADLKTAEDKYAAALGITDELFALGVKNRVDAGASGGVNALGREFALLRLGHQSYLDAAGETYIKAIETLLAKH